MGQKVLSILLLLFLLIVPISVKADRDLDGEINLYSEGTTVGSTVVFKYRAICGNECDEVLKYDPNVLQFVSVETHFPNWEMSNIATPSVKVISNESGVLKYDYTLTKNSDIKEEVYNIDTEIIVKFNVLTVPTDGKIIIDSAPLDNNKNEIEGLRNVLEIKAFANGDCNCPKCEQKNDTCNCTEGNQIKKECKNDNTWFIIGIISLIFNVILLVVILLLAKKKNNNSNNIETEKKDSTKNQ